MEKRLSIRLNQCINAERESDYKCANETHIFYEAFMCNLNTYYPSKNLTRIQTGSVIDGSSCSTMSDHDVMTIETNMIVTSEADMEFDECYQYITVKGPKTKPGFTKLKLARKPEHDMYGYYIDCNHETREEHTSLCWKSACLHDACQSGDFLSSSKYKCVKISQLNKQCKPDLNDGEARHIQGPALTINNDSLRSGVCSDYVSAIYMPQWPVKKWLVRKSLTNWPSKALKERIASNGCFLVPTGSQKSHEEDLEWRYSFSLAERMLMENITAIQRNCLIIVKALLKYFINNESGCGIIKSYFVKTLLFWIIETNCKIKWETNKLLDCVKILLKELISHIKMESLKNYFVEEANLLEGKITDNKSKKLLLKNLRDIHQNIPKFLMWLATKYDSVFVTLLASQERSPLLYFITEFYTRKIKFQQVFLGKMEMCVLSIILIQCMMSIGATGIPFEFVDSQNEVIKQCRMRPYMKKNKVAEVLFRNIYNNDKYSMLSTVTAHWIYHCESRVLLARYSKHFTYASVFPTRDTIETMRATSQYMNITYRILQISDNSCGVCMKHILLVLFYLNSFSYQSALEQILKAKNSYRPYYKPNEQVPLYESYEKCVSRSIQKWYTGKYMFRVSFFLMEYNSLPHLLQYEMLYNRAQRNITNKMYRGQPAHQKDSFYLSWHPVCMFIFLQFIVALGERSGKDVTIIFQEFTDFIQIKMKSEFGIEEWASVYNIYAWCGLKGKLYLSQESQSKAIQSLCYTGRYTSLGAPDMMEDPFIKETDNKIKAAFSHHLIQYVIGEVLNSNVSECHVN